MARTKPAETAGVPRKGVASLAARHSAKESNENQPVTHQDQTPRYGLRKRGHEDSEDIAPERPKKARGTRTTQFGHTKSDETTTKSKDKGKGKTKVPKAPAKTYTCRICAEDVPESRFPRKTACPSSCADCLTGENRICKACIVSTIVAQLESRDPERLGCPSCNEPWTYRHIVSFLPPTQVTRLDARIVNRGIAKEDGWRWCAHKNCNYGQIYEAINTFGANPDYCSLYFCQGCHRANCFKHQNVWHDNLSCAQYDFRQENERVKQGGKTNEEMEEQEREALALMQTQQTRICPYCGHGVQKTVGCDNMQCFVCGESFLLTTAKKVTVEPAIKHEYNMRKRKDIKYTR